VTSVARSNFVAGIQAFDVALANRFVIAGTPEAEFVRRGLNVAVYNLLETFVSERASELAAYINSGHLGFNDLPEAMQRRSVKNVLSVAAAKVRHVDAVDLMTFIEPVGQSLAAVRGPVKLSGLIWAWTGSNMQGDDYFGALRSLHVKEPGTAVREISGFLKFGTQDISGNDLNVKLELESFAASRHQAAHDSRYSATVLWLTNASMTARKLAIGFDALASASAFLLRAGDQAFLQDPLFMSAQKVPVRRVEKRQRDFAAYRPGAVNAYKVDTNEAVLFKAAIAQSASNELVVLFGRNGTVVDWSFPAVG